jgi:hypothetical protein
MHYDAKAHEFASRGFMENSRRVFVGPHRLWFLGYQEMHLVLLPLPWFHWLCQPMSSI